ncbi:MAG: XdhC family protein [Glaciecola sp.]|jgi:xanthine/CO dehydrogenase XdhC/CoxF family maturation factor
MANHIQQLLNTWYQHRDQMEWVLATIIEIDGSSYRKPGAMMMINSMGKYHGLLSGGCLESDIMRQARQCWQSGRNHIIQYDMREEEDIAWQLGIGCGGLVRILLQAVNKENNYLQLDTLRHYINRNQSCEYIQKLTETVPHNELIESSPEGIEHQTRAIKSKLTDSEFKQVIAPVKHIAIFGGGVDAIPVAKIAANVGWQITIADPRTSYARSNEFPDATHISKLPFGNIDEMPWLQEIDAIIIMTHNVQLDADALNAAQESSASYVGMLGPTHRTERVLSIQGLELSTLKVPLANPIGLKLGGELPESIALSIIAEIHAHFEGCDGHSISHILV